jgi:hypothetical protein
MNNPSMASPHEFIEGVLDAEQERKWLPWAVYALLALRKAKI